MWLRNQVYLKIIQNNIYNAEQQIYPTIENNRKIGTFPGKPIREYLLISQSIHSRL